MIVMKFGGSSIKDVPAMRRVASIVQERRAQKPLVVLSALGGVTDALISAHTQALEQNLTGAVAIARQLRERHIEMVEALIPQDAIREKILRYLEAEFQKLHTFLHVVHSIKVHSSEVYSSLIGLGELLSSHIFNAYLESLHVPSVCVDVRPVMKIDLVHGEVEPDMEAIAKLARLHFLPSIKKGHIVITQGFLATTKNGAPATLGRDGSDYTASILGAALQAEEIQIWSDVDGILSADPTIIKNARPLSFMTFDEACELAYFGARVLHPATIQPAVSHGIPVRVLNSHYPQEQGTLIVPDYPNKDQRAIRSIAYKENITLVTIESSKLLLSPKLIEAIFEILTRHGKKVYAVNKAATKLSVTIQNNGSSEAFLEELKPFGTVLLEPHKVVVSVVGERMKGNPELSWQIIRLLHEQGIKIELISQFSKQISLMFIIDEADIDETVRLIHSRFIAQGENGERESDQRD